MLKQFTVLKHLLIYYRVPTEDPSGHSLILDRSEFNRIRSKARVVTHDELMTQEEALKKAKEDLMVSGEIFFNIIRIRLKDCQCCDVIIVITVFSLLCILD